MVEFFLTGVKRLSLPQNCLDRVCGPPSLLFDEYRGSFPPVNLSEGEVYHSHLSSAEVKSY